jgi:nucleoside-diphosphate-sugar epimerase
MRILVVGGAGYVGSSLIPALIERGYAVDVVDVKWFGVHLPPEVSVVDKHILGLTTADLEPYEQVIFLAGLSNDPMAEFDPAENFQSNGAMPSYLAYLAKQVGVRRVIYASSCSVYGYTVNELYDEDSPAISSFPYGISKLQGERGVLQMHDEDFSTIALRKGTICGYSPRMRFDLIVNTMYKSCIQDGKITVNNPSLWRPILDMRDAVSAYLRAIQADYSINGIFNVASDNYTVGQVGDKVKEKMEDLLDRRIKLELKNIQDFRNYKVDISKARTVLGFEPSHDVSGIIDDLHAHRDLYGDLDADAYYNIRVFQTLHGNSSSGQSAIAPGGRTPASR